MRSNLIYGTGNIYAYFNSRVISAIIDNREIIRYNNMELMARKCGDYQLGIQKNRSIIADSLMTTTSSKLYNPTSAGIKLIALSAVKSVVKSAIYYLMSRCSEGFTFPKENLRYAFVADIRKR